MPKWFMVLTMSAVLGLGGTSIGFLWQSSLEAAITSDRQKRIEEKLVKIEGALADAGRDRWSSAQDAVQDAKVEAAIRREFGRLESRLEKLELDRRGPR